MINCLLFECVSINAGINKNILIQSIVKICSIIIRRKPWLNVQDQSFEICIQISSENRQLRKSLVVD